jgi:hypothetical protein
MRVDLLTRGDGRRVRRECRPWSSRKNGVAAGFINVVDDRDGGTMFDFADPDGNAWVVQQIRARAGAPLLPHPKL